MTAETPAEGYSNADWIPLELRPDDCGLSRLVGLPQRDDVRRFVGTVAGPAGTASVYCGQGIVATFDVVRPDLVIEVVCADPRARELVGLLLGSGAASALASKAEVTVDLHPSTALRAASELAVHDWRLRTVPVRLDPIATQQEVIGIVERAIASGLPFEDRLASEREVLESIAEDNEGGAIVLPLTHRGPWGPITVPDHGRDKAAAPEDAKQRLFPSSWELGVGFLPPGLVDPTERAITATFLDGQLTVEASTVAGNADIDAPILWAVVASTESGDLVHYGQMRLVGERFIATMTMPHGFDFEDAWVTLGRSPRYRPADFAERSEALRYVMLAVYEGVDTSGARKWWNAALGALERLEQQLSDSRMKMRDKQALLDVIRRDRLIARFHLGTLGDDEVASVPPGARAHVAPAVE